MNEVLNVSIAKVSFTITKEAHGILEDYLSELKSFYTKDSQGQEEEILSDIEERIVELLYERGKKGSIVTEEDIRDIIGILGRPKDFEASSDSSSEQNSPESSPSSTGDSEPTVKKRLYRDMSRRIIGGVCSGLSNYFNMDVAIIRIIFVTMIALPVLFKVFDIDIFNLFHFLRRATWIIYVILWIAMPAARTVEQRCSMMGYNEGVDDIKRMRNNKNASNPVNEERGHIIGNIFKVAIGIILMVTGISLLIGFFASCVAFSVEKAGTFDFLSIWQSLDYVDFGIKHVLVARIFAIAAWILPSIGILYGGVMLTFSLKAPKWRPGLVIFLLSLIAIFGAIGFIAKAGIVCSADDEMKEVADLNVYGTDTLYVQLENAFPASNPTVHWTENERRLAVTAMDVNASDGEKMIARYPVIRIKRIKPEIQDSSSTNTNTVSYKPYLKCTWDEYPSMMFTNGIANSYKTFKGSEFYSLNDSLLTVKPLRITKDNKYCLTDPSITLYVGNTTTVILVNRSDFGNHSNEDDYFGKLPAVQEYDKESCREISVDASDDKHENVHVSISPLGIKVDVNEETKTE